jgi:hypothetical protein
MAFYRDSIIAALVVFFILDGAAMAGRVFTRTKIVARGFGWDDAALCLTYVREDPRYLAPAVKSRLTHRCYTGWLCLRLRHVLGINGIWLRCGRRTTIL